MPLRPVGDADGSPEHSNFPRSSEYRPPLPPAVMQPHVVPWPEHHPPQALQARVPAACPHSAACPRHSAWDPWMGPPFQPHAPCARPGLSSGTFALKAGEYWRGPCAPQDPAQESGTGSVGNSALQVPEQKLPPQGLWRLLKKTGNDASGPGGAPPTLTEAKDLATLGEVSFQSGTWCPQRTRVPPPPASPSSRPVSSGTSNV